jgi:enoyl-CoA hydratase/carnithine racemase
MSDRADASVTLDLAGPVARVRISNPGKRNAFTWGMYDQLEQIALRLRDEPGVRVVVLRGDREDGFAAGTDIGQFGDFADGAAGVRYERRVARVLGALTRVPAPTIAAVERTAVGAGLAVAACCDLVVAERDARFGAPIARTLGNCLPIAVVHRLRSGMGAAAARSMLLSAQLVTADRLTGSGFVHALADSGGLDAVLEPLIERIRRLAPLTLRVLKEMNRRLEDIELPDDTALLELCYGSADFREGVRAFGERRRPEWKGE